MKRNNRGFSLPELLIVVAIIGIIASIAVPALLEAQRASREAAAIQTLRTIVTAENTYISTKGGYQQYGDGPQLSGAGLIDSAFLTAPSNRYQVALTLGSPGTTYTATSEPISPTTTGHFYYTSNDGVIHWHAGASAGPGDPSIPQ
jgi:prepilin-type N-terminal cleavage/methylation domain-containing protein